MIAQTLMKEIPLNTPAKFNFLDINYAHLKYHIKLMLYFKKSNIVLEEN